MNSGDGDSDVVKDLQIIELSGIRHSNRRVRSATATVELEGHRFEEETPVQLRLRAVAKLVESDSEVGQEADSTEDEDRLLFTGAVQFLIVLDDEHSDTGDDEVVGLVWPHIRAELIAHARSLGVSQFKLPAFVR
ncbi:hypothetical protein [Isoptericola haloaureus]|uniref:Preprotein translocase subunit SecB n=1 Tax=Isoptericola haloaureus TaxID=1542902 RepID=A0ABU7Z836_9MICO